MQNTGEAENLEDDSAGWLNTLSSLTDDELQRYGEIAEDQRRAELDRMWAQVLCAVAGCLAVLLAGWEFWHAGLTWRGVLALGGGLVLGYWPYRKAVVRRLWRRHCRAVAREQDSRRRAGRDKA